ncbi:MULTISPECIES: ABC transporter substrate-binding protein [unclassified Clostridium]|mgnify:FL=1|jgi:peptide/nickel transport system substrate-binding protein|uniref:ABC transporter substrate-binding protein n=1 Tax=unclassified Clostridium TaxID=2614128 RepID=UPI00110687B8|nr:MULTISPECIES: ABC transporter substrate-binding protein [unclassified Clostridium]
MKRKLALVLAMVMVLGSLAGCGSKNGGSPSEQGSSAVSGESAGTKAGVIIETGDKINSTYTDNTPQANLPVTAVEDTLTVALASEPASLDIFQLSDSAATLVSKVHCEGLLRRNDATMEYEGVLAKSWENLDDTTIRFHLRDDVYFHNGEKMTAEDVLFMYQRGNELPLQSSFYNMYDLEKCKVIDDYTLDIVTFEPFPPMEDFMSDPADCVLSKKAIESSTPEALVRDLNGAGTGPYKFVEWIAGDRIVFERNENYWGEKPEFKNLVFRIITDSTARTLAFEAGDVDICMQPLTTSVDSLRQNPNCDIWTCDTFTTSNIVFNCTVAPLDNKKVREALAYALDLDTIVDTVFSGTGRKHDSFFTPQNEGYHPADPEKHKALLEYNPEKAKELLAEAGYPDGFTIKLWTNESQNRIDLAEILQNNWGAIGVKVDVSIMEFATLMAEYSKGIHDVVICAFAPTGKDGQFYYPYMHSTGPFRRNYAGIRNPEIDKLMETAQSSLDKEERAADYAKVIDILREEVYMIPLHNSENIFGVRSTLTNFEPNPVSLPRLAIVKSK